jgi:O-antigen/teichoic acid export membrane protein
MLLALAINIPATVLQTGLMAQRRFTAQLVNRIIFSILVAVFCPIAVLLYGLNGAAIGFAMAAALQLPVVLLLLRRASWPKPSEA